MNNLIKTSNNEDEILKSQGPFRIISSDDSNIQYIETNGVIINIPEISEIDNSASEKILDKDKLIDIENMNLNFKSFLKI